MIAHMCRYMVLYHVLFVRGVQRNV